MSNSAATFRFPKAIRVVNLIAGIILAVGAVALVITGLVQADGIFFAIGTLFIGVAVLAFWNATSRRKSK